MSFGRLPSESALLRAACALLDLRGVWWMRLNTGAARLGGRYVRFGVAGCPDLLLCVRGQMALVEVKTPAGRLSPAQAAFHANALAAGAVVAVVRDVGQLEALLAELGVGGDA